MPRSGKVAAATEQVHESVLAMREVLALAAGHEPAHLVWEARDQPMRWDLVHRDGRWLGGVIVEMAGKAMTVRQAAGPAPAPRQSPTEEPDDRA